MVKKIICIALLILCIGACKRNTYPVARVKEPIDKPSYNVEPVLNPPPSN